MTSPPASDDALAEWARRTRSGDLEAFEALFRHLHPMLTRIAHSLADGPQAQDAVQETFVRLWEQRERIDPDRSVKAYLARSVRNRLLNASRDAQTRRTLLDQNAAEVTPAALPRPDADAQHRTLADRLATLLQALPDRQRLAITLTRFDGLSHAEAADVMACSARTVNNHIVRGLRTLRDRLQAYDLDAR
ncbi:RNA polymerase sigma factor [Rubrivirga sp.]|uniref:RNA polymerase sigma factor n=1 Tax=Rubrivirga sp. TaxID=1885344 RepID=UPI003C761FE2